MTALPSTTSKTNVDDGGDSVAQGRGDIATAIDNLNTIRSYLSGLFGTDGTKSTARSTLGLGTAAVEAVDSGTWLQTAAIAANAVTSDKVKAAFIADLTDITPTTSDLLWVGDADDSNNNKRCTVQEIVDLAGGLTEGTEEDLTVSPSPSQVTFSGISSGTKRVIIVFNEVSMNTSNGVDIILGDSGGLETSGYVSADARLREATSPSVQFATGGFRILGTSDGLSGHMILTRVDSGGLTWVASWSMKTRDASGTEEVATGGGVKTLTAELSQISIDPDSTAVLNGGSINIQYE